MKILRFEGYSFKELIKDTDLFRAAVARFVESKPKKVHRISFNLAHFALLCGAAVVISPTAKGTVIRAVDGTELAIVGLRDNQDFPQDGIWLASTDDGFFDYTCRRAGGYGIVGKYEYSFGLGYKRHPIEKKEYFRERRGASKNGTAGNNSKTIKHEKNDKHRGHGDGRRRK